MMFFNPDSFKHTMEIDLSPKSNTIIHPDLIFNHQKHLALILDVYFQFSIIDNV